MVLKCLMISTSDFASRQFPPLNLPPDNFYWWKLLHIWWISIGEQTGCLQWFPIHLKAFWVAEHGGFRRKSEPFTFLLRGNTRFLSFSTLKLVVESTVVEVDRNRNRNWNQNRKVLRICRYCFSISRNFRCVLSA